MYDPDDYGLAIDDIPTWMRPRYRGWDWTLLVTLALCLTIALPILTEPTDSLPRSPDAEMHMYRILEMSESIQEGIIYPRWAPHFNYGYGSPLFNHVAPLPHYLGALYVVLAEDTPHVALKAILMLAIFLCGISTMGFVRQRWGDLAGVIAAAVLLFSPYMALIGPYLLSDLGGLWALGLFMSTLWMLDRTMFEGQGRSMILLAASTGGLLIADNALSPMFFALVVMWAVLNLSIHHRTYQWKTAVMGLLLGVGLSSFYHVPAILEHNAVHWDALPVYPEAVDTQQLFDPVQSLDRSAFNPIPTPQLGVATWLLAGIGLCWLIFAIVSPKQHDTSALYFLLPGIIMVGAMFSPNAEWWSDDFESLKPDELLGPLTGCCAILAAQIVGILNYFRHPTNRFIAIGIITAILLSSAANTLYTPSFLPIQRATLNQHLNNIELRGHALSTIRNGHLLPQNVNSLPEPSLALISTRDLERIEKLERQGLNPGTRVVISSQGPTHDEYNIESPAKQQITILTFNYPGWKATLNNKAQPIISTSEQGLITVDINQGLNILEISFEETQSRTIGWLLSGMALVLSLFCGYRLERSQSTPPSAFVNPHMLRLRQQRQLLAGIIVLGLVSVNTIIRLNPELVTRRTPTNSIPTEIYLMDLIVQGGVSLLGYKFDYTEPLDPGETLMLTTYWSADSTNVPNYQIRLSVVRDDQIVQQQQYRHLANWPTKRWPHDSYILANYEIAVPDIPGRYEITLELAPCDRVDLHSCHESDFSEIYDLRTGSIARQIVLPQPIIIR